MTPSATIASDRPGSAPKSEQRFLLNLTDAQRKAANGREIMQISAEMLCRHLDVGRVGYSEATPDRKSMTFETGWAQGGLQTLSGSVPMDHWSEDTSSDFLSGRTVVYPDVRLEPSLASEVDNYLEIGALSVVAAPFLRRGEWRGSLYVNHSEPRQWTAEEVSLIEEVAERTAEAVERAQAETELRALADRLLQEQEHLSLSLDATRASAFDWDLSTDSVQWIGQPPFGRDAGELTRSGTVLALIHPEDQALVGQILAEALSGSAEYTMEYRATWVGGSLHWVRSSARLVRDAQGTPLRVLGINVDITEQKLAADALLRTEKLAAVGRLASSIAHEINNPLESVMNLLYLAKTNADPELLHEYLDSAERELRRVSAISNQTLRFNKQSTRPTVVTCYDLFAEALSIYQGRLVNSGIEILKRKRAKYPAECFEGEIRQVLSNLISNAIDAMQVSGGRLVLRSRDATHPRTGMKGLVLTVADTGGGIAPDQKKKIFDAFYTTKGAGGTGLGMWISKEIVDRHRGELRFRSSQRAGHCGTVFSVFLPSKAVARA